MWFNKNSNHSNQRNTHGITCRVSACPFFLKRSIPLQAIRCSRFSAWRVYGFQSCRISLSSTRCWFVPLATTSLQPSVSNSPSRARPNHHPMIKAMMDSRRSSVSCIQIFPRSKPLCLSPIIHKVSVPAFPNPARTWKSQYSREAPRLVLLEQREHMRFPSICAIGSQTPAGQYHQPYYHLTQALCHYQLSTVRRLTPSPPSRHLSMRKPPKSRAQSQRKTVNPKTLLTLFCKRTNFFLKKTILLVINQVGIILKEEELAVIS